MLALIFIVIGYLIGSICFAVLFARFFDLPNPLEEGSKNPGATNILRLSSKKHALIVLLADVLKGFIPVIIAKAFGLGYFALGLVALFTVLGHMYPVFFDFKGGKGVATAIGGIFALSPGIGIIVIATWLIVAFFSRYSSLSSLISLGLAPLLFLINPYRSHAFIPLLIMFIFIMYQHRLNIERLRNKEEPKINLKKDKID